MYDEEIPGSTVRCLDDLAMPQANRVGHQVGVVADWARRTHRCDESMPPLPSN
jgi:hypothetical protein